ncbi:glycosyl hydrolase family 18 protein [Tissierella sp. Yu-01]|uniref:glycosyl hydrolase family 18 protein n=1 Tax=Tissierella sp. Yu-01 TaxID=3035694 RepID=UPI00240D622E|nr:glycosyl hydrolase family 18 protein [Tissierella sp. Yu-01]WFA09024.1 glycosyl hydrolase family 18 protein [Tissierella sp. Yu-01]
MNFIRNYKLEKNENGYTLVLYLDIGLTEFADEFGSNREDQNENLNKFIKNFIENKFPDLKINSVKLIVGSIVVANITMQGITGYAAKAETKVKPVFNMTYAYFGAGNALIDTLSKTGNVLDVVSPSYFDLTSDGNLHLTSQFDSYTIKEMQKRNFKVVPFLSNHWDQAKGQAALKNRKVLIKDLVKVINEYNLDGINVDIENLSHTDRDNFTLFIKELREALPKDKEVSVAVVANPNGWTSGYYGSFDNENLAKYVDYLMIMSYDEHYEGDNTPGPVSSIQFTERSIQHLLKDVPPSKIVVGLPFYGRYWKSDGSIKGKGISLIRINELVKKYNGKINFDTRYKSPKATVNITGNEKDIPKGTYEIWFENEESILNKLQLIEKYDLKGAGSWSLHQATQNIWDVYNQWSNSSSIFIDVEEGWAKAPILAINEKGWMVGTRDFYFEPNTPLTRAQAATLLVRILDLSRNNTTSPYFIDVQNNHWAKTDIELAAQHGLMNGKGNQRFAPDEFMTREEMATLLYRLLEVSPSDNKKQSPFKDIDSNRWSYQYILSMAENKIFEGFEDKTFRPTDKITRAQMAALLDRIKDMIP